MSSTHQNTSRPATRPASAPLQASTRTNSSANTSACQSSYSSTSSLNSPLRPSADSAPLPSPSSSYPRHEGFFGSLNQHQHHQAQQQTQQFPPQQGSTYNYHPNREGAGRTAAETDAFLSHAGLLAEAAKRAQMAVVMRDIEGMEL